MPSDYFASHVGGLCLTILPNLREIRQDKGATGRLAGGGCRQADDDTQSADTVRVAGAHVPPPKPFPTEGGRDQIQPSHSRGSPSPLVGEEPAPDPVSSTGQALIRGWGEGESSRQYCSLRRPPKRLQPAPLPADSTPDAKPSTGTARSPHPNRREGRFNAVPVGRKGALGWSNALVRRICRRAAISFPLRPT